MKFLKSELCVKKKQGRRIKEQQQQDGKNG
jgi:hypothetical protein